MNYLKCTFIDSIQYNYSKTHVIDCELKISHMHGDMQPFHGSWCDRVVLLDLSTIRCNGPWLMSTRSFENDHIRTRKRACTSGIGTYPSTQLESRCVTEHQPDNDSRAISQVALPSSPPARDLGACRGCSASSAVFDRNVLRAWQHSIPSRQNDKVPASPPQKSQAFREVNSIATG